MKQNFPLYFFLILIFVSCSVSKKMADNHLTKEERKQGYRLLFDGKTMNGWRPYQNKKSDSWIVDKGTLYRKGNAVNHGSVSTDLITINEFENFDLSVDWKIPPKGNSGILYLIKEDSNASYLNGPEYQIIDDENYPEKLEDWQKTAGDYAMYTAPGAEPWPPGEWNHTRIVVNKNHVEHWLNGKKVVEYELYSNDWQKRKMAGKWKDTPGYGLTKKGHIVFQDHGSESWFKNIKIKEW